MLIEQAVRVVYCLLQGLWFREFCYGWLMPLFHRPHDQSGLILAYIRFVFQKVTQALFAEVLLVLIRMGSTVTLCPAYLGFKSWLSWGEISGNFLKSLTVNARIVLQTRPWPLPSIEFGIPYSWHEIWNGRNIHIQSTVFSDVGLCFLVHRY